MDDGPRPSTRVIQMAEPNHHEQIQDSLLEGRTTSRFSSGH
jgi:hypothetical protein